jgi:hypothetical protein
MNLLSSTQPSLAGAASRAAVRGVGIGQARGSFDAASFFANAAPPGAPDC